MEHEFEKHHEKIAQLISDRKEQHETFRKHTRLITATAACFTVGLLILGIFYSMLYLPIATEKVKKKLNSQNTPLTSPKPTKNSTNSTANWKTYTNSQHQISIQYPENAKQNDATPNSAIFSSSGSLPEKTFESEREGWILGIEITDNEKLSDAIDSFRAYYENQNKIYPQKKYTLSTESQTTIGTSIPATKIDLTSLTNTDFNSYYFVQLPSKKILQLRVGATNKNMHLYQPIIDQILSTFKFLGEQKPNPQTLLERQFEIDSRISSVKNYPSTLINLNEKNLIGMSCTPYYSDDGDGNYFDYDSEKDTKQKADSSLLSIAKEALKTLPPYKVSRNVYGQEKEIPNTVDGFEFCKTENGKKIFNYQSSDDDTGVFSNTNIGLVGDQNSVIKIADFPNTTVPYLGCSIFQLSDKNQLYLFCRGGDGPAGGVSIHTVDLLQKIKKTIFSCKLFSDTSTTPTTESIDCN